MLFVGVKNIHDVRLWLLACDSCLFLAYIMGFLHFYIYFDLFLIFCCYICSIQRVNAVAEIPLSLEEWNLRCCLYRFSQQL